MTDTGIEHALRALPHFKTMPSDLLAGIATMSRVLRPEVGEILFHEGAPCHHFYAIQSGSVKLYRAQADGREQVVHHLHAGGTFAEAALLSFKRFPVSAIATEPSTVLLEIGGERFLELFRSDARLAPAMIGSLCMRLVSLVERVEELSLVQAGTRLARWLLRQPAHGKDEPTVELALPKKELAAHLAMTPETLSRLLGRWQDEGWIRNERTRLVLLDARSLLALADEVSGPA
jgi:CRP/FNR family transcriptional regulator